MNTEVLRKIDPQQFHYAFISNGVRSDGRALNSFRKLHFSKNVISNCNGSASLRCGRSFVIASVKAEIVNDFYEPPTTANEGTKELHANELLSTNPSDIEQIYSASQPVIFFYIKFPKTHGFEIHDSLGPLLHIETHVKLGLSKLFNDPEVIDPKGLMVNDSSTSSWILHVNINFIEYDGNFFDLCLLVALAALENTQLPHVEWDFKSKWWREKELFPSHTADYSLNKSNDTQTQNELESKNYYTSINVVNRPLSSTFINVFNQYWVTDPSKEEEDIGISVNVYQIGNRYLINKEGGYELDTQEIEKTLCKMTPPIFREMNRSLDELKFST